MASLKESLGTSPQPWTAAFDELVYRVKGFFREESPDEEYRASCEAVIRRMCDMGLISKADFTEKLRRGFTTIQFGINMTGCAFGTGTSTGDVLDFVAFTNGSSLNGIETFEVAWLDEEHLERCSDLVRNRYSPEGFYTLNNFDIMDETADLSDFIKTFDWDGIIG